MYRLLDSVVALHVASLSLQGKKSRSAETRPQPALRRGAVLLVVLVMLMLFAALALAFVYYAESEATASRYHRESQTATAFRPNVDPELLLAYFLGKLIYGDYNDETGVWSALRGHDLARGVYGYPDVWDPNRNLFAVQVGLNTTPFNGLGRVHQQVIPGIDDYYQPCYIYYQTLGDPLRDPEHKGTRLALNPTLLTPFVGGANPGWTYVDLNTMCLAAVNASGEVLMQSFYRPWAGDGKNQIGTLSSSTYWKADPTLLTTYPWLKGASLRPLPAWHNDGQNPSVKYFPPPADGGGDVKNLEGLPGVRNPIQPGTYYNNDSIWIDIGFPVLTDPATGRKYKPLFAALVVDLDNKINLNASGNIRGAGSTFDAQHLSNQGWGVWEVALWRALTAAGNQSQWRNLFLGANGTSGRYGPDSQPSTSGSSAGSGETPRVYAQVDFDASTAPNYAPPQKLLVPGDNNSNYPNRGSFLCMPYFPTGTYTNGDSYERTNHPSLYNVFFPQGDDRNFGPWEMEPLLRYWGTGTLALSSDLFRLCPLDFSNSRSRLLVTTHSFDLSGPGALPWLNQTNIQSGGYIIPPTAKPPIPQGSPVPTLPLPTVSPTGPNGEFQTERRAATALLGRLDLDQLFGNVTLPPYPKPGTGNAAPGQLDPNDPQFTQAQQARQQLAQDLFNRLVWVTTGQPLPADSTQRGQYLSQLRTNNLPQYNALRWLAQLAVNIVDYRDPDDISTPFNWDPSDPGNQNGGWVFGVELPRLVINEAYVEVDNTPADLQKIQNMQPPDLKQFQVNFWVELLNPLQADPNLADPITGQASAARLSLPLTLPSGQPNNLGNWPTAGGYPLGAYRLVIAQQDAQNTVHNRLTDLSNTTGNLFDPTSPTGYLSQVMTIAQVFAPQPAPAPQPNPNVDTTLVLPSNGNYTGPYYNNGNIDPKGNIGSNQGFYVLGTQYGVPGTDPSFPGTDPNRPRPTLILKDQQVQDPLTGKPVRSSMTYEVPAVPAGQLTQLGNLNHTLLLQRLANPYLPPQGDPTHPNYNPYITIDYTENVPVNKNIGIQVAADNNGVPQPQPAPTWTQMYAVGRKQPYAADQNNLVQQKPDSDNNSKNGIQPYAQMPQHTMFRHNGVGNGGALGNTIPVPGNPAGNPPQPYGNQETIKVPFDWLVHLDRQLVNPAELWCVAACSPSQLTQLFMNPAPFSHLAPWQNPNTLLYRFLEFVQTASRASGVGLSSGGRWPGKININTIWDPEILDALLDPQPSSYFTATVPNGAALLSSLLLSRTPNGTPGATDRPFLPLSAPYLAMNDSQYPQWSSATFNPAVNTPSLLRLDPAASALAGGKQLFGVAPTPVPAGYPTTPLHPYLQMEILQKIFNNITTRSNVFAVWVTVGFFEVLDDTVRPVKLGPEVGIAEGRNVRHRMFAIIDRSNLAIPAPLTATPGGGPVTLGQSVKANLQAPQTVPLSAVSGTSLAPPPVGVKMDWIIQPGSLVQIGNEVVWVQAVAGNTITAYFSQDHNAGDDLVVSPPGWPGNNNQWPLLTVTLPGNGGTNSSGPVTTQMPATPGPIPGTVLGNPGPQPIYDPRGNGSVVLYFHIIE
jgi:hypothetical protein